MKAIILLFSMLSISQPLFAARICAEYITDEWPDSRYYVENLSGDHVVTDKKTGLMWKRCTEGLSGADCSSGNLSLLFWQESLVLSDDFAGFSDWRLPNIKELRSLLALNCYYPAINETAFPNTTLAMFWSSSPMTDDDQDTWVVDFYGNIEQSDYRGSQHLARLVRSTQ